MRKLVVSLLGIALLGGTSAAVAGGNGVPKPVVDVQMQCNTMVGVFEVDAAAARAVLPPRRSWRCNATATRSCTCRPRTATVQATVSR
jgi:hypothetical protein